MIETILNDLSSFFQKYGGILTAGIIGAVVHRIRNKMSFKSFIGVICISSFIGFCVGITVRHYLTPSNEITYVICSIAGVFSKDILDEIEEVIKMISEYVRKKLGISSNELLNNQYNKEDKDNEEEVH